MESSTNEDLKNCITQYKLRLQEILQRLAWSEDKVLKDFNTNSVASSSKEIKKPRSPIIASYPESCITKNSLVLETAQLQEVLQNNGVQAPRNFKELQANFSRDQKLKIYEHVIENTEKLESNTETQVTEGEISLADILAQKKREEKRKKRRFRKSKPTHIEEVRCLVDLQMEALQQFMGHKINKEVDDTGQERSDKNEYRNKESYQGVDYYTKANYNERQPNDEYYKINPYRDRFNEQRSRNLRLKTEDFRRRPRSPSKERKCYESNQSKYNTNGRIKHSRSRSKEFSYGRKRRSHCNEISHERQRHGRSRSKDRKRHKNKRSCSKERTRNRRSHSKEITQQRSRHNRSRSKDRTKKRSKYCRSRSKEISKERIKHRSRSHSKDIYKERRKHRSRSKSYERFSKSNYQKHSKKRDNDFKEKSCHQEQYYGKQ